MAAPASEVARSREVSRMLRIRRTVLKMLMDRGYMVSNEEANITREEFERDFTDNGVVVYVLQRRAYAKHAEPRADRYCTISRVLAAWGQPRQNADFGQHEGRPS